MEKPILTAHNITKVFPGVKALNNVDFDLRAGEVHILVGENGAGKSTLAKCLLGAHNPEEGEIRLHGEKVRFHSAKDALKEGIAAVYQEFTLVPYLNVAQNIFLNREYRDKMGLLNHKRMQTESRELLSKLNCGYIDVKTIVKKLSVAEQQMVEIAKALSFKPRIIVFDEPTAALSEREVDSLFQQIHKLKESGIGIIYVSHRMQEFSRIGDRITILRDGNYVGTYGIKEKTVEDLVNLMVGRDISQVYKRTKNPIGEIVLKAENLSDKAGRVKSVSVELKKGEIVGLAGLVGAGRTEFAKLLFGIDLVAGGKLFINGKEVFAHDPASIVKYGIGLVPEDRKRTGLALKDSVAWNTMAVSLKKHLPRVFVDNKKMMEIVEKYKKVLRIATPSVHRACRYLSGGNQQKVVLAKWLSMEPEILIFDEPTRGIDVGAKLEIYAIMDQLACEGKAILMISSELPEILGMSDRIYIMHEGKITGHVERNSPLFSQEKVAAKMLGIAESGVSFEIN
ncbi:MAG: sugar ABC transporter ATP-binding protein [Treponemataceae bacterium]